MSKYQVTVVHEVEGAETDIVFIHGLKGNLTETWTKDKVLWPRDLLPKDIPNCRILLYGYDSTVVSTDRATLAKTEVEADAGDLCARLLSDRQAAGMAKNPIIFVAHSLGGLVAAQALVAGETGSAEDVSQQISSRIVGMIFLGTPFRGSSVARPFEAIRNIMSLVGVPTQDRTLTLLGVDSDQVRRLNEALSKALRQRTEARKPVRAVFFYESLSTNGVHIVNRESALMPNSGECLSIQANHHTICKFASDKDEGYQFVMTRIRDFIEMAKLEPSAAGGESHTYYNSGKFANLAQGRATQNIPHQVVNL